MKKISYVLLIMTSVLIILTGCSTSETTIAIENYIDHVSLLNEKQEQMMLGYEKKFVFEEDWDMASQNLVDHIIPEVTAFVGDLSSIELEVEELEEVHSVYLEAHELFLSILQAYVAAIETHDEALFNDADAQIADFNSLLLQYEDELVQLASKHGIELQFEQ